MLRKRRTPLSLSIILLVLYVLLVIILLTSWL
ncbi:uncharacterized membrane protein (DUF485 family) [Paenibacillus harenae]|uniref:Uncharacterized membrane protein (DUF485 family) n=1 Tax=Paenibacillus harenae TaxID=306543 RepID=A0ABT9TZB7_PAEHA|nr:uncharacterized membrane protein (DUF485 family) [Paenibacillus harenae]MDQ0112701.1 uncharacterized membrane protein (DUF485 family) [Paenibacillus harenae]